MTLKFEIHLHIHADDLRVLREIDRLSATIDRDTQTMQSTVAHATQKETLMSKVSDALEALKEKYAAQQAVDESAKTLLAGLAQQIRDNVDDPTALNELADKIDADTASMAAAVSENTPAEE